MPVFAVGDPLIMGVFPRRNAKVTFVAFSPLVEHLSKKLRRPVMLEISNIFQTFWQGLTTKRYDIVHYNQYHYVRSHAQLGYNVIAMNEEFGRSTIAGAIDVRIDSGINSIADLKGRKIIFGGGVKAMMSYITPTYLLRQAGLMKNDYREVFATNPPNAILTTYFSQAHAAGVGDAVILMPVVSAKCDIAKLKHLAVSQPMAHLPWAVSNNIDLPTASEIKNILVTLKNSKQGQVILLRAKLTNIISAEDKDYDEHRKVIFSVLGEKY